MPLRFGINGLGRVGRALLRIVLTRDDLRRHLLPAAVNDVVAAPILARLLARDTVQGRFSLPVTAEPETLIVDGIRIPVLQQPDPALVPWDEPRVELVVEATGRFLPRKRAAAHLRGGVRTVVISANGDPVDPVDATLCLGVSPDVGGPDDGWDPERQPVISNASCTTNALALMTRVLHDRFGVRRAMMSTVHSYTENQRLLDLPHPDPRRSRAAALNIIPTSTTAAAAAGFLLPGLEGRIDGFSVRVPTPAVALLDLVADLERPATPEAIRQAYAEAASGDLAGLLGTTEDEPVSSDFVGDPRSVVIDLPLVQAVDGLVRVVGWYDNEWGYANRLAELLARVARRFEREGSDPHA